MSEVRVTEVPVPTALYRILGEADLLLYIGISKDFGRRWRQHARKQPWWEDRRRMTVEWHDSRPEAKVAEDTAVKTEGPKYNQLLVPRPPASPRPRKPQPYVRKTPPAGWVSVTEAARRAGCSRQCIYDAAKGGHLQLWRPPGKAQLVGEDALAGWAAMRPARKVRPFGLSDRQAELLLDVYLRRPYNPEYGMLIVTRRSLRNRGLLTECNALTDEGEKVARELRRQQGAEVNAA